MKEKVTTNPLADYDYIEMDKFTPLIEVLSSMDKYLDSVIVKEVTEEDVPYTGAQIGDKYFEYSFKGTDKKIYLPVGNLSIAEYRFLDGLIEANGEVKIDESYVALKSDIEAEASRVNNMIGELNGAVSTSINSLNQNMVDGFNTINGGIDNEIRPSISGNSKNIEAISGNVEEVKSSVESLSGNVETALKEKVDWVPLGGDAERPDRKAICLGNHDAILGYSEVDKDNCSLLMLSKWDKVDVGSAKKAININTPTGVRPTIQEANQSGEEANQMAYLSDIPNMLGKFIDGNKLFKITSESTSDEIKEALSYKYYTSAGTTTITEEDLQKCLKNGLFIYDILYQPIQVNWTGSAWLLTEVGMISPKSEIYVSTVAFTITDGEYKCVKNGKREKVMSDTSSLENQISLLENRLSEMMKSTGKGIIGEDGTEYSSINDALLAGATKITLNNDVSGDINVGILPSGDTSTLNTEEKTITIIGNGMTIKGQIKNTINNSDITLIVKDAIIESPSGDSNHFGILSQNQDNPSVSKFNLTLEDATIKDFNHKGIYITNAGTIQINRCKFINNCGDSDYVVDFNLCGVQNANISIKDCQFSENMGGTSAIKVTQRGGEDDYAKDIFTGVWIWSGDTYVSNPSGVQATIESLEIDNCKFIGNTSRKADITIGSSPNAEDSPAPGPRTSNGNFSYLINNGGITKVWKRYEGENVIVQM